MDTLHTLLGAALLASLVGNIISMHLTREADNRAAIWRAGLRHAHLELAELLRVYHDLRMNSHRRDRKTGRLLPLGE